MRSIILPVIIILIVVIGGIIMTNKKSNVPIETLKSFSFGYSTGTAMYANVEYDIECSEKCIATIKPNEVSEENAKKIEIDEKMIQELITFLNENKVYKWDGFQKSDPYVLDGNSFHFYFHEKNGRGISATGYMMYPKNYGVVRGKLDQMFQTLYEANK